MFLLGALICEEISIHAPREGSDLVDVPAILAKDISIHAPREGSDFAEAEEKTEAVNAFLSTLPARGATGAVIAQCDVIVYFYPRSPRGERPACSTPASRSPTTFLSTLPARGATSSPPALPSAW